MTILVTGAAGFIGTHLLRSLTAFDDVSHARLEEPIVALDLLPVGVKDSLISAIKADIRSDAEMAALADMQGFRDLNVTTCIHLAAIASPPIAARAPATAWATNVHGTHNVLQLCHRIGVKRVVFMSSAHCVGIPPRYLPTNEEAPLHMVDHYTVTKLMGERLCELFFQQHGLSYCTLRLWNAYGTGQSQDYFLGKKLLQASRGHITIRNADVTKDFLHVSDAVRAIQLAMVSDYVGPLHIGTGIETHLGDIVKTIADRFGLVPEDEQVPPEGPSRMACDWSRARRILGWEPKVRFEDGLEELIEQARKEAA